METKTDPYQIPVDSFLLLQNTVFTTTGRLTKRNGFNNLTSLPNTLQTNLTTLNGNLIATGTDLYAYNADSNQWLNKGIVQPVQLNTIPVTRTSSAQYAADAAIASNNIICTVYADSDGSCYYQLSTTTPGEQLVSRVALESTATNPRVFTLGNYFIVTYMATNTVTTLKYIAIPIYNIENPNTAAAFNSVVSSLNAGYDGYVLNNNLFLSWSASATSLNISILTSNLQISAAVSTVTTSACSLVSVTADTTNSVIYVTYYNTSLNSVSFTTSLVPLMTATTGGSPSNVATLTSLFQNGILNIYYETTNLVTQLSNTDQNYVSGVQITPPAASGVGTLTKAAYVILRSVGLASKPIVLNNVIYFLVAYGQPSTSNQQSYFLIDSTGQIYMRLAYSNGGGYEQTQVLPSISSLNGTYYVPYLYKDFLTSVNKGTATGVPSAAIYTQTGINIAAFTLNESQQFSSEIAGSLNLTGGQLWQYDGVVPVENNFQVWPEDMSVTSSTTGGSLAPQTYFYQFTYEWTDNTGNIHRSAPSIPIEVTVKTTPLTFTSVFAANASSITVSSVTGLYVGQVLTDNTTAGNLQGGTYITSISGTTIGLSLPTVAASASTPGDTLQTVDTGSDTIYVPTLRLTSKQPDPTEIAAGATIVNPVRIVGYRWSTNQQTYYQFTSITSPYINDPTVDYITITDTLSDNQIVGNPIIYTNGGVVEDIAAPPSTASALFNNRLWLVDAEDQNLLWFSKQVIEAVPVEMSDLLTIYVAPTSGAQGSTGVITAIYPMDDKLVIFKKDAIYYINGIGPDNTGANSQYSDPIFITSSVGCSTPNSIVLMPNGLMFQSDKGIWLLGRDLSTQYIGSPVEAYNSYTVLSAQSIPTTNQVRFILNNNVTLMFDYFVGQWAIHTNVLAISATLYEGYHTYLNSQGMIYQETPNVFTDGSSPVLISLKTAWINIAGLQGYERFYFGYLLGTYYTPFKLSVSIAYDYSVGPSQNITISPDNYSANWGGQALWGSGAPWGGPGNVFEARFFPQVQKCESFQVSIQEVYDASLGVAPGQGLSLSGLNLVTGVKKGYRTQRAARSFGSN